MTGPETANAQGASSRDTNSPAVPAQPNISNADTSSSLADTTHSRAFGQLSSTRGVPLKSGWRPNVWPKRTLAPWARAATAMRQRAKDQAEREKRRNDRRKALAAASARRAMARRNAYGGRRMPRVSKVLAVLNRQDAAIRVDWWKDPKNFWCAVCGVKPATQRHHTRGRTRRLQNDPRWWAGLCEECHERVKNEPKWAQAFTLFRGTIREQPLLASGRAWMNSETKGTK